MIVRISPNHTTDEFVDHWTLDDKIEVFIDRIKGWQTRVADEIIKSDILGRELVLLHKLGSFVFYPHLCPANQSLNFQFGLQLG